MTFPEPYRARPARRDDLDALVELFEARDPTDVGCVDQARDEIVEDWASVRFDFDRDTVIIEAPGGAIAAYGVVLALDPTTQIFAIGKVHPNWRSIRTQIDGQPSAGSVSASSHMAAQSYPSGKRSRGMRSGRSGSTDIK